MPGPTHNPHDGEPNVQLNEIRRQYWRKNLTITGGLLVIWFLVTFGVAFFARELSFNFFGWPFSFWVAAQGALIVYILIVWFYARSLNGMDQEHQAGEERS